MKKRAKKNEAIKSPLTKEQILQTMKDNQEFQKRMKFTREIFWPKLLEMDESIEDIQMFLSGMNTALMQSFLNKMKDYKFAQMELDKQIAGDYEKYKSILSIFDEMDVFDAKAHIEGMRNEISLFLQDEQKKRKLKDLKPTWLEDYLKQ